MALNVPRKWSITPSGLSIRALGSKSFADTGTDERQRLSGDYIRLYRVDDNGELSWNWLASANTDVSVAPRDLRLESQCSTTRPGSRTLPPLRSAASSPRRPQYIMPDSTRGGRRQSTKNCILKAAGCRTLHVGS